MLIPTIALLTITASASPIINPSISPFNPSPAQIAQFTPDCNAFNILQTSIAIMTYAQFTALASAFASQINAKLSHDFNIQTNGQLPSAQSFAAFQQQAKTTPCIPASPVGPQGPVGPIALSKSAGSSKGKSKSSKSKSSKSSKKQAKSSFSSSSSISNKALAPLSSTSAALAGVGIGGGVSEPLEILMECASQAHVSINIATAQLCVSAFLLDFASTPIKGPTPLLGITCLVVAANGPPALQIGGCVINQFVDLAFGVDENTDTGSAGLNPASFTSVTTSNSQCPIDEGNLELYLGFDLSKFNSNVPACHGRCLPTTPPPPLDRSNGRTPVLNEGFYNDIPVIFGNIALSEFIDLPNSRGSHSVFTVTNSGFLVTAYTRLANAELSLNNPTALASRARTIAGNLGSTNDFSQTVRQSSNFCNVLMEKPIGSANTCIPHSQDGTKFVEFRYKTGSGTRDCLERYVLEIIPGPPVVIVKRYYTWGHYFTGTWIPIEMNPVP